MFRKTWAFWLLLFHIFNGLIYPLLAKHNQWFNLATLKGRIFLPAFIITTGILIFFAYEQFKMIQKQYRLIKKYPLAFGESLTKWNILALAILDEKHEIVKKVIPFHERDIKKLQLEKQQAEKNYQRVYKKAYKQAEQALYDLRELHAWHLHLKESLSDSLAYDATPFTECVQLSAEIKQELIKTKAELQQIADEQILEKEFDLNLFAEIEKKMVAYSQLTIKAFEENKKISQARQKIFDKGNGILADSKQKIKLDTKSQALLEEIIAIVAQPLKPGDLRRVQYQFEKIIAKVSS
jgi:hypothetical protein